MVPGAVWRYLLVLAVAAVGSRAQGLKADWLSLQPLYQEDVAANWPSVVVPAPTASSGVRDIDPWAWGNLCVLVTAESINGISRNCHCRKYQLHLKKYLSRQADRIRF